MPGFGAERIVGVDRIPDVDQQRTAGASVVDRGEGRVADGESAELVWRLDRVAAPVRAAAREECAESEADEEEARHRAMPPATRSVVERGRSLEEVPMWTTCSRASSVHADAAMS